MFIIILRISASNAFEMFFFGGRGGGTWYILKSL